MLPFFMVLSSLACLLLLPTLISAHMTISEVPVNLAAHHVKQLLATPLKNLLQKRDTVLFAGSPTASNILALNSTNGQVVETIPFQEKIYIPGQGPEIYFIVMGELDSDLQVTVEFWVHYDLDRRIGVYHGDLANGCDMKIPATIHIITGEAVLYAQVDPDDADYDALVFEAYGAVSIKGSTVKFPDFKRTIDRWYVGDVKSIKSVTGGAGVQALALNTKGVDTAFSEE